MDDVEPKNGNGTHEDPMIVEVKNQQPLLTPSQIIKLLVIGITIAVLVPTSVTLYLFTLDSKDTRELAEQNARLTESNRKLIEAVDKQRVGGDQRAYEQCVQGEARDRAFAETWGAALLLLRQGNVGSDRTVFDLIEKIEDSIADTEPPDELECKPPTEVTP